MALGACTLCHVLVIMGACESLILVLIPPPPMQVCKCSQEITTSPYTLSSQKTISLLSFPLSNTQTSELVLHTLVDRCCMVYCLCCHGSQWILHHYLTWHLRSLVLVRSPWLHLTSRTSLQELLTCVVIVVKVNCNWRTSCLLMFCRCWCKCMDQCTWTLQPATGNSPRHILLALQSSHIPPPHNSFIPSCHPHLSLYFFPLQANGSNRGHPEQSGKSSCQPAQSHFDSGTSFRCGSF